MYPVIIEVSRQEDPLRFRNVNQPCKALPRITDILFYRGPLPLRSALQGLEFTRRDKVVSPFSSAPCHTSSTRNEGLAVRRRYPLQILQGLLSGMGDDETPLARGVA